ncbi:MAG TPA: hypothetical protein VJT80_23055 [Steroidobacteraceae bacterium]|nr:hypothetical protein [Steroidobacteraceae bacterium]
MIRSLPFAALLLTAAAATSQAEDAWRYSVGIHDFAVPDENSDTYGINGGVSVDKHTGSGRHVYGSAVIYVDYDQDDLDPSRYPIWWQVHLGTDGDFWKSERTRLGWNADLNTRMNTASSIEREMTAMPALVAAYDSNVFGASAQASAGWFFLEIDDDVPKEQGYVREDRGAFRNSTLGYSLAADMTLKLGSTFSASGEAQEWWDSHDWLQTRYKVALRMATGQSHGQTSEFVLSADFSEYNLDPYFRPEVGVPIMPWDNDVLIRLSFDTAWNR